MLEQFSAGFPATVFRLRGDTSLFAGDLSRWVQLWSEQSKTPAVLVSVSGPAPRVLASSDAEMARFSATVAALCAAAPSALGSRGIAAADRASGTIGNIAEMPGHNLIVELPVEGSVALYGALACYPVIYSWEDPSRPHCLAGVPLTLFSVRAERAPRGSALREAHRSSDPDPHVDHRSPGAIPQGSEGQSSIVFSFSVPTSLLADERVATAIAEWRKSVSRATLPVHITTEVLAPISSFQSYRRACS